MVRVSGTFFSLIHFFIENSFFLFLSSSHHSLAMLLARSMTESVVRPVLLVGTVVLIGAVVQPSGGVWTNVLKTCPAEFVWSRSEILVPFVCTREWNGTRC